MLAPLMIDCKEPSDFCPLPNGCAFRNINDYNTFAASEAVSHEAMKGFSCDLPNAKFQFTWKWYYDLEK